MRPNLAIYSTAFLPVWHKQILFLEFCPFSSTIQTMQRRQLLIFQKKFLNAFRSNCLSQPESSSYFDVSLIFNQMHLSLTDQKKQITALCLHQTVHQKSQKFHARKFDLKWSLVFIEFIFSSNTMKPLQHIFGWKLYIFTYGTFQ